MQDCAQLSDCWSDKYFKWPFFGCHGWSLSKTSRFPDFFYLVCRKASFCRPSCQPVLLRLKLSGFWRCQAVELLCIRKLKWSSAGHAIIRLLGCQPHLSWCWRLHIRQVQPAPSCDIIRSDLFAYLCWIISVGSAKIGSSLIFVIAVLWIRIFFFLIRIQVRDGAVLFSFDHHGNIIQTRRGNRSETENRHR